MDIDMPGISGIEAVARIQAEFACIKVLMLTVFDENHKIFQSICNGAVGYILKKEEPMKILEAVQQAFEGGAPMSPCIAVKILHMFRRNNHTHHEEINLSTRELEILSLLSKGYSYKMIAAESQICIDTVRFHIKKIYDKLHVHSMTEAVSKAIKNKWV
jgi:DNA-binding NarL/FixJ family response regulator